MRNLRRVAAIACGTALVFATPAQAGTTHTGRCGLRPHHLDVTTATFSAFLYAVVAVQSADATGNPVGATVTCELRVAGRLAAAARGTGAGVVAVLDHVWFGAAEDEELVLCTVVDFADATPTATECVPWTTPQVPPQVVWDTLEDALDQVWPVVDPPVCAALASLAPGDGPVVINAQGDVYVAGEPVWDCPPYDVEWDRR
ncbi:MAG TPA: hypothetical protein VNA20_10890 [Frankiaceae bacterium]|nr:hypothetical protein [Frankiaceae bacterium]